MSIKKCFLRESLPNIRKYLPCPNLCGCMCCSLFESAHTDQSLVSTIVCPVFIKVVADLAISGQCFYFPKSATFCLSNAEVKLWYNVSFIYSSVIYRPRGIWQIHLNLQLLSTNQILFYFHQSGLYPSYLECLLLKLMKKYFKRIFDLFKCCVKWR